MLKKIEIETMGLIHAEIELINAEDIGMVR